MDQLEKLYQVKQARQKGQILYDSAYLKYLEEANSSREKVLEVTRGCQERERDLLFRVRDFHVAMLRSLSTESSGGCTALRMSSLPLIYVLKTG